MLGTILVPEAVREEVGAMPAGAAVVSPAADGVVRVLSLQLDSGEAAAVAVAVERQAGLIVDERRARRIAARMGVPVVGTIGVLLLAWKQGRVGDPVWMATDIRERGLYLSDELIAALRRQVEERGSGPRP